MSLVKTYFIAKQYRQMGWTTGSNNINYDPSHDSAIQNRYTVLKVLLKLTKRQLKFEMRTGWKTQVQ